MAATVKVRCNGAGRHVNEVNLDKALQPSMALKGRGAAAGADIPERLVLQCRECTEGKVILTRQQIEATLNRG